MYVQEGQKQVAVLCVLRHNDSYLLLKRLKDPNKDTYTPVGGKLDPYEDPGRAAIRETLEETGIEVRSLAYCGVLVETSPTRYNWVSMVYLADIERVVPPPCNEGTLEWIGPEGLLQVPTPATDRYIYQFITQSRPFALNAVYDAHLNLLSLHELIAGEALPVQPE